MKILIAEDDPTNQKIALIWLTRNGHSVTIVPDGQACVDRYCAESFDVVLMDIKMPIMSGIEATVEIRAAKTRTIHRAYPSSQLPLPL
jgi:CheY-like chemotaxis protein